MTSLINELPVIKAINFLCGYIIIYFYTTPKILVKTVNSKYQFVAVLSDLSK